MGLELQDEDLDCRIIATSLDSSSMLSVLKLLIPAQVLGLPKLLTNTGCPSPGSHCPSVQSLGDNKQCSNTWVPDFYVGDPDWVFIPPSACFSPGSCRCLGLTSRFPPLPLSVHVRVSSSQTNIFLKFNCTRTVLSKSFHIM